MFRSLTYLPRASNRVLQQCFKAQALQVGASRHLLNSTTRGARFHPAHSFQVRHYSYRTRFLYPIKSPSEALLVFCLAACLIGFGEYLTYADRELDLDEQYKVGEAHAIEENKILNNNSEKGQVCAAIIMRLSRELKLYSPEMKFVLLYFEDPAIRIIKEGVIYISDGIFDIVKSEGELAALIAFQMAYYKARRTQLYVSDVETDKESMDLMAQANYDPKKVIEIWSKLGSLTGGHEVAMHNAHPMTERRMQTQQEYLQHALTLYSPATPSTSPVFWQQLHPQQHAME